MSAEDPDLQTLLLDLFEGRRSRRDVIPRLTRHLAGEAPETVERLLAEFEAENPDAAAGTGAYAQAFARAGRRTAAALGDLRREAAQAQAELAELLAVRGARRRATVIQRSPGMCSPHLVEALIDEAVRTRRTDLRLALELTQAAGLVARRLPPDRHPFEARLRCTLRAEAHRANVLRLLGDLTEADSVWSLLWAWRLYEPLTAPDEEAELLSLEASLRIDLRQFAKAESLLARAERVYREIEDPVGVARVLIKMGAAAEHGSESERAVELFERAAAGLPVRSAPPVLVLMAWKNLAAALVSCGRTADAAAVLAEHRALLDSCAEPIERLRWRWVEARLARAEGRLEESEGILADLRNAWIAAQYHYDVALATLDLAEVQLALGKWEEVRQLATRLEPVFASQKVHREAKRALELACQAAAAEAITPVLLGEVRQYLLVAQRDRNFVFEPGAKWSAE